MNTYNKQQTVHLLPVPFEVSEIINSFLFQDMETVTKERKKNIVNAINTACSRKNPQGTLCLSRKPDTSEVWTFCVDPSQQQPSGLLIEAYNCTKCGNYKYSNTEIQRRIECIHILYPYPPLSNF